MEPAIARLLAAVLLVALIAVGGCGGDDDEPATPDPPAQDQPAEAKPTASEIVATCADETGQDTFSTGKPVPGFVDCLRRLDAPQQTIDSWTGG